MTDYLPPDPERHEAPEPERNVTEAWGAVDVFGGLCVLAIVLTCCIVFAAWAI